VVVRDGMTKVQAGAMKMSCVEGAVVVVCGVVEEEVREWCKGVV